MRVVVTGGAGFLGSHVADALAAAGHTVTVFDQRAAASHGTIVGDLLDPNAIRSAFHGRDAVCHLGAIGDVYLAAQSPAIAAAVNVTGTANVCDAALAEGISRVVVASTWEVYGKPRYEPLDEDHPCRPDHPYSITKLAGEQIARSYAELRNLPVLSLRLGTAFGTRMRPNSVFSIFVRNALNGVPITIQGSGKQSRQFTHARDIGRAFVSALSNGESGKCYNVVADRLISIRELAQAVTRLAPTQLTFGPERPGDVPSARVSNTAARRDLGWEPTVDFEEGLSEILDAERTSIAR